MSQSLSAVFIHLVFSTKVRRPFLRDLELRARTHAYLAGISKELECDPVLVGGVEDHVHLLCRLGRTISQAEWDQRAQAGFVLVAEGTGTGPSVIPMAGRLC